VAELQGELAKSNAWAADLDGLLSNAAFRIVELQTEVEVKNDWAASVSRESDSRGARIVALQQELEERTAWAKALDARLQEFEASRWVRVGKTLRVGPLAP